MSVQDMIQEARQLSPAERKELMRALVEMLPEGDSPAPKKRSILELRGLGEEIWEGIDAQEYVRQIRGEWDHRP